MIHTEMTQELTQHLDRYVRINTISDPHSDTTPSTACQWDLLKLLEQEMQAMGLSEISLDDKGYLFATLPANTDKAIPVLGLLAHVDTSPDYSGEAVKPQIIHNYDGDDILLAGSGEYLSPRDYPALQALIGHRLMTADGSTLLGADDKAGIAIILCAMKYLLAHPEIEHGKIRIGFTPDEEIGRGPHHFDVQAFGADIAYTLDGSSLGELQYENFNAAKVALTFHGLNIHPGSAKDKMINGFERAVEFHQALPPHLRPENSSGREGFIFLHDISGTLEAAHLHYLLRDFSAEGMQEKKAAFHHTFAALQQKYGEDFASLSISDQYQNMHEKVSQHPKLIEIAEAAMKDLGITPLCEPIRGGTDGAQLSFKGLPTPNLFTGGANFHGRFEYISIDVMNLSLNVVLNIIQRFAHQ